MEHDATPTRHKAVAKPVKLGLRRYAGLISFLGVAIVLATFLVKDVLRDRERDRVGSFESAKTAWVLKKSIDDLGVWVGTLQYESNNPTLDSEKGNQLTFRKLRLDAGLRAAANDMQENDILEENLFAQHKFYKQAVQQRAADYQSIKNEFSYWFYTAHPSSKDEDIIKRLEALENDLGLLSAYLAMDTQTIIKAFEAEASHAKRHLRTFTYFTWGLYPAGVLIGIIGQLAGLKDAGKTE